MARYSYLIEWDQLATMAARILEGLQALGLVQFETLREYPAGRAWRLWLAGLGDLGRWDCFKSGAGRSVILIGALPLAPGLDRERSAARAAHLEALEAAFFHLLDQEPTEPGEAQQLEAEPGQAPSLPADLEKILQAMRANDDPRLEDVRRYFMDEVSQKILALEWRIKYDNETITAEDVKKFMARVRADYPGFDWPNKQTYSKIPVQKSHSDPLRPID